MNIKADISRYASVGLQESSLGGEGGEEGERELARRLCISPRFRAASFSRALFSLSLDGLRERGTARSLIPTMPPPPPCGH